MADSKREIQDLRPRYHNNDVFLVSAGISEGLDLYQEQRHRHGEDIEKLKQEIEQKEREINNLRKSVKDLEEKNKELDISLKARNDEVKKLKERIHVLEEEKKRLEEELASVKYKLTALESEVKALSNANDRQEEEKQKLAEKLALVESKVQSFKEELDDSKEEHSKLRKGVKELEDVVKLRTFHPESRLLGQSWNQLALSTGTQLMESDAMIKFGQLCWEIQSKMYQYVLPEYFTTLRNGYKIKNIKNDLKKLPKTPEEAKKAEERWQRLKTELNWDERYEQTMKDLQDGRNKEAHPPLKESNLRELAEKMNEKGLLKGWLSYDYIKNLIDIRRRLDSLTESDKSK